MAAIKPGTADLAFEAVIRGEKASALGRTGARLEALLEQLVQIETELARGEADRGALVARHAEVREQAKEQLWFLVVQREAMGLNRHGDVYRIYQIPPRLR
jgi:hypothetical protein